MSINVDITCVICLAPLGIRYARNVCRHRFHMDCLGAIFNHCPALEVACCPCCREEFQERAVFSFDFPLSGNIASNEENIQELDIMMKARRKALPQNATTQDRTKRYLKSKKQSLKAIKQSRMNLRKSQLAIIQKLYVHIKDDFKSQYLVKNLDKVCKCGNSTCSSRKTLNVLEKQLRQTRADRAKLARTKDISQESAIISLPEFATDEICQSCGLAKLPFTIMEYYALDRNTADSIKSDGHVIYNKKTCTSVAK